MEQRLSIIGLGVRDLGAARAFYDALGWKVATEEGVENIVCYDLNGIGLSLYPWDKLAEDAKVSPVGDGFRGISVAYNVRHKEDVAPMLAAAEKAGGKIVKPAEDVFWGGHSGYFTDPDGHLWEVAWNPYSPLGKNGEFSWIGAS